MFYTGIITSLLPYFLVLGVFGTLIMNQVFSGVPDRDDPTSECHHKEGNLAYHPSSDASAYYCNIFEDESNKRPEKQTCQGVSQGIPVFIPPGAAAGYFTQPAHPDDLTGMNRTYSLRGPPQM
ncbi:MAG TPA: hypothetical protein VJ876_03820 [Bacteroidales bacterium]|nr:hypothetical protein [Bacteroidales bacterium]